MLRAAAELQVIAEGTSVAISLAAPAACKLGLLVATNLKHAAGTKLFHKICHILAHIW
jgi:hypothetical protein